MNHQIRVPEVRLIGEDGHPYGIVSMDEARRIAEGLGVDLIEISPNAVPPVVKAIDYGKYKYTLQKKINEAKKKQVVVLLKEIQFRPNIDIHDIETKVRHAEKFLGNGDKIKLVMQFRGREMAYKDLGMEKFNKIINMIIELGGILESPPKFMGNRVFAMMSPDKKVVAPVKPKHSSDHDQPKHSESKAEGKDNGRKETPGGSEASSSNS
ncbi:MAG: translation initiation factor IF-3 [Bdellovibrionales bacterium GWA2_49_15]|nr:MAG: translation initiation factor IF-3 [Bdellovibrionales bacterium GWA2_49_15]